MSKMFDALRWAEDQRRRISTRIQDVSPIQRPGGVRAVLSGGHVSPGLLRELGVLRNSLETVFNGKDVRSIMFVSAAPGEGTTTIATSFAHFLSMQGMKRTLTVELNARRPSFADVFSINGDAGITDYFIGESDLRSLVRHAEGSDVPVMQVGKKDPSIIQLHLQTVFPNFLRDAHQHYDTLIIDAPPAISCPESPPMAGFVDGVVVVVHAGKTKREVVQRAFDSIKQFNGNILGVVLNRRRFYIPNFLYKRI